VTQWTWTAADGTVVPLSDWNNGVYVLEGLKKASQGTLGQFAPEYEFGEQTFAGVDGSTLLQVITHPRQPQLGIEMVGDDATLRARMRVWARALRPKAGIGRLTATQDDGSSRYLNCYYRSGLDQVMYQSGRARMALMFWAPSPWWRGVPLQVPPWGFAAPAPFFPITPVSLSSTSITGARTIDLSDTDAPTFPQWTITGPGAQLTLTNAYLGVQSDGTLAAMTQQLVLAPTGGIADGRVVTINTAPGYQSVLRDDGVSLFGGLASDPAMFPLVDGVNNVTAQLTGAGANSAISVTADRLYSGAL
jgi:hypothetical protein